MELNAVDNIINAKKEWKEKYEKDYGEWGDFIIYDFETNKLIHSNTL